MPLLDYNAVREKQVAEEEDELLRLTGHTSRDGTGSAAAPMKRDPGKTLRAKHGAGPIPSAKRSPVGRMLHHVHDTARDHRWVDQHREEFATEVDRVRELLGLDSNEGEETTMGKARVTGEEILAAVVAKGDAGATAADIAELFGLCKTSVSGVLSDIAEHGGLLTKPGPCGPKGGRHPLVYYARPGTPKPKQPKPPTPATTTTPSADNQGVTDASEAVVEMLSAIGRIIEVYVQNRVRAEVEAKMRAVREVLSAIKP